MKIFNRSKGTIVAEKAEIADTVLSRLIGLLNRSSLHSDEALVITQCRSIHMFFMRFPIDAIFVSIDNCVVGLVKGIKPFRLSPVFFKSRYVIEIPEGNIVQSKTSVGDKIEIKNI